MYIDNYKEVIQLQHQIQELKNEARQMIMAPMIDARFGIKLIIRLSNCASNADRESLKTDAELRKLAAKLQARLRTGAE